MQGLTVAVTLVTMLLGVVLSIRLLQLAASTRKAPELAMGIYCALVTTGTLFGVAAYRQGVGAGLDSGSESIRWLSAAFTLCIGLGTFTLAELNRRVPAPVEEDTVADSTPPQPPRRR